MVLLKAVVTRCHEAETLLSWVTRGLSEELVQSVRAMAHSLLSLQQNSWATLLHQSLVIMVNV